MNEKSKWEREENAKYCKEQTIFGSEGILPNPKSYAEKQHYDFQKVVICPFCLTSNQAYSFVIKEGNRYLGKCPNKSCKQQVQFKTLFNMLNWSGKEFADFVYPYSKMNFWGKIRPCFHDWKERLIFYGISTAFWERYKELKGDYQDESE